MTVSGYGYSAWGTSPYGAEVGLVSIIRAFAAGDRVVIVVDGARGQEASAERFPPLTMY